MKILLFCLPGLGDTLMFTPLIRQLKANYPNASLEVATMFKSSSEILENNPFIDKIFLFDFLYGGKLQTVKHIRELRRSQYDISIMAFPAFRREYHLLSFLVGAKRRIAHRFSKSFYSQLNFLNTDLVRVDDNVHNIFNNLNILHALGIKWKKQLSSREIKYDIFWNRKDDRFARDFIAGVELSTGAKKIFCFHIGSMKYKGNELKRWREENFLKVGKELLKMYNATIIILAGEYEKDESKKMQENLGERSVLVESFSTGKIAAILEKSDLFLGNDGGLAHLSAGLGIPTIVLFGVTDPEHCRPWGKKVTVIESKRCQHCYNYCDKVFRCKVKSGQKCIDFITVDQVIGSIKKIIQ